MIRIAAVSDLHFEPGREPEIAARFAGASERADLLLLPGDLTDHGTVEEAEILGGLLGELGFPVLAVMGNHDLAARTPALFSEALLKHNVRVLDGEAVELEVNGQRLGIAGVRGYMGGFGDNMLTDTTEPQTEAWVKLANAEAGRLERSLSNLSADVRVAMLHYAPIPGTVVGEHPETFPFYGSSRLLEPIERHKPAMVVHGHAHNGTHRGTTPGGIPVYNVALRVIGVPFVVLEVDS